MQTKSVSLRFKPIRIGWCVKQGDLAGLKTALELSHTLWGGKFNPIIPVGNLELQASVVRRFHVDILFPISECDDVKEFIEQYTYLKAPFELDEILGRGEGSRPNFLDIYHPCRRIHEQFSGKEMPFIPRLLAWHDDDPLALALLASVGNYPSKAKEYNRFFEQLPKYEKVDLAQTAEIPPTLYEYFSPSELTIYCTEFGLGSRGDLGGFYVGDSGSFDDLSEYWNLRATGKELWFYDPTHAKRLDGLKLNLIQYLNEHTNADPLWPDRDSPRIAVHSRDEKLKSEDFGGSVLLNRIDPYSWNGLNIKPPVIYLKDSNLIGHSVIGIFEKETNTLTVPLPNKPFYMDNLHVSSQHLTYCVTSDLPNIAELNDYYGFNYHFLRFHVRAQKDGIGIFGHTYSDSLTLHPISPDKVIVELFKVFGIIASLSQPGLLAKRLIAQMGGLQDCRAFKIAGVRNLLKEIGLRAYVTRSTSIETISGIKGIANETEKQKRIKEFRDKYGILYIEAREPPYATLNAHDVFDYLLKKKVFQAGLEIKCSSCLLEFWLPIDDVKTHVNCSYCDHQFNITPMLRDRDWRFRRSGLFSMDEQGSVPVALLLQQMDTAFHGLYFSTALNLESSFADINKCETDFVFLASGGKYGNEKQQIVIGECKTADMIDRNDINNLAKVKNALKHEELDVFFLFSKLVPFTEAEIQLCKSLQPKYERRVIILTDQQLEPYHMYEWTPKEAGIEKYAIDLEDMAENTHKLYFQSKW